MPRGVTVWSHSVVTALAAGGVALLLSLALVGCSGADGGDGRRAAPPGAGPTTTRAPAPPPPTAGAASAGAPDALEGLPRFFAAVVREAGVVDPTVLAPSPALVLSTPGEVVENRDVDGTITVNADNVTIRNVRVRGASDTALIAIGRGVRGTIVEHATIEVAEGGANGAIGYLGEGTIVRRCDISGFADGIKVESGGLYELNYIHMAKPDGAAKHLDGIQGSGDTDYTIRSNVIDADVARGGNAAIFVQAWNGARNVDVANVVVSGNYLVGGNFTVYLEGGKDTDGSDPASWVHNFQLTNNTFAPDRYRYGLVRIANCDETVLATNITADGRPLPNPCR
jgi:hypothetical protein